MAGKIQNHGKTESSGMKLNSVKLSVNHTYNVHDDIPQFIVFKVRNKISVSVFIPICNVIRIDLLDIIQDDVWGQVWNQVKNETQIGL